jgi:hypothetical protein
MEELTADLERVVGLYEVELEKANRRQEFECGPWLIAKGISLMIFDVWSKPFLGCGKSHLLRREGKFFFIGIPSYLTHVPRGGLFPKLSQKSAGILGRKFHRSCMV